jgi:hypothetical protein
MNKEVAIRKMLQSCEKDPELFAKLVEKPQEVAREHGVALEPEELQQLQRVKKLQDLVEEFKQGRVIGHPVGYPVDVLWKKTLANHILSDRSIFYPIWGYGWGYVIGTGYRGGYSIGYIIRYPYRPTATEAGQFSGLRSRGSKRRS